MTSERSNAQLFMLRGHNQNVCPLQECAGSPEKLNGRFLIGQIFKTIF